MSRRLRKHTLNISTFHSYTTIDYQYHPLLKHAPDNLTLLDTVGTVLDTHSQPLVNTMGDAHSSKQAQWGLSMESCAREAVLNTVLNTVWPLENGPRDRPKKEAVPGPHVLVAAVSAAREPAVV